MNKQIFKLWLFVRGLTVTDVARMTGITTATIHNYCKRDRFPLLFILAIRDLDNGLHNKPDFL